VLIEGNPFKTDLDFDEIRDQGRSHIDPGNLVCSRHLFAKQRRNQGYHAHDREAGRGLQGCDPFKRGLPTQEAQIQATVHFAGPSKGGSQGSQKAARPFWICIRRYERHSGKLMEVDGIGRVSAEKIREVLDIKS
jgi:hypothetical protein